MSEQRLQCPLCDASFLQSKTFLRHSITEHNIGDGGRCEDTTTVKKDDINQNGRHTPQTAAGSKDGQHKPRTSSGNKHEYYCFGCNLNFSCRNFLITHNKTVHGGVHPNNCNICGKQFSKKANLAAHIRVVHHGGIHPADNIADIREEDTTVKQDDQQTPKASFAPIREYYCFGCNINFSCQGLLTTHTSTVHNGVHPTDCNICGKRFAQKTNLAAHVRKVHLGVGHECGKCGLKYDRKHRLENHMRQQHGVKSTDAENEKMKPKVSYDAMVALMKEKGSKQGLKVDIKQEETKLELKQTMQSFNYIKQEEIPIKTEPFLESIKSMPTKPWKCSICRSCFSSKSALAVHLNTLHLGNNKKHIPCPRSGCTQTFSKKSTVDSHVNGVHDQTVAYTCKLCGAKYRYARSLKEHTKVVHEGFRPFVCLHCNTGFGRASYLESHVVKCRMNSSV